MANHLKMSEKDAALGLSEKLPVLSDRVPYVAPSAVNPTKIRTDLTCSETTILWQHFVADSYSDISHAWSAPNTTWVREACRPAISH